MATESCFCRAVLSLWHCPLHLIYMFLSLHVPLLPPFLSLFSFKTFLCCHSGHLGSWSQQPGNFLIHFYVAEKKTNKTTTRGEKKHQKKKKTKNKTLMQSKADGIDACLGNSSSVPFNVTNRIETTVDVVNC